MEQETLVKECQTKIRLAAGEAINPLWEIGSPYSKIGVYNGNYQFLFSTEAFRAWQIFDAVCQCDSSKGCSGDIRWVEEPRSVCLIDKRQPCGASATKF